MLWKRIIYGLGMVLAGVSVLYVLYQVYDERIWEVGDDVLVRLAGASLLGIVVYSLSSLLLAVAWHAELGWCGEDPRSLALSLGIYGRAQLAKYAPGNIFSLVGRQILGRQAGFSHKVLAWASILEVFGMLYAAGLLACAGAGNWARSLLGMPKTLFFIAVLAIALFPLLLLRAMRQHKLTSRLALPVKAIGDYARLNGIFLIYVPFFLVSGLIFALLMQAASLGVEIGWLEVASTVSAIWLIGYVTPGASAGIGIRDALLLLAIDGIIEGSLATLVVVVYRMVTIVGDIGFFGLATLVRLPVDVRSAHTH
jgi:uncharacterized membrane protein YbhN (UPF0104 family)